MRYDFFFLPEKFIVMLHYILLYFISWILDRKGTKAYNIIFKFPLPCRNSFSMHLNINAGL